jgi:hypothetical protein
MHRERAAALETDLRTLADAANDAAKREATQWFYFVTIMLTLTALVGSTTHRLLFLEEPVKVPLLSIELPLVGFYITARNFHFISLLPTYKSKTDDRKGVSLPYRS